ncbi:PASTA domain-containing protein [Streptomyces abikoensis]|uniref:PASTA domain-containing protein n=1 Tax=Streptomyces abikoensis TaxID=97398 RepID=UPI0033DC6E3F
MTIEDAQQLLQSQGLQTGTTEPVSDAATPGTVIDQIPPPGEPASPGSTVTLLVASATGPSTEPILPPEPTETPLITRSSRREHPDPGHGGVQLLRRHDERLTGLSPGAGHPLRNS